MTPPRRVLLGFGVAALVLVLLWGAGFAWFVHLTVRVSQLPAHTDGIVALTGGPERVETALRLLANGRADRLLLSGIGGGAELTELAHRAGLEPMPLADRVTIDRGATTTRGNARATAEWAQAHALRTLLVVTASYHMPRALTELARALPGITLYPLSVVAPARSDRAATPWRLVAEEYLKFLASKAGLSALLSTRDAMPDRGGRSG